MKETILNLCSVMSGEFLLRAATFFAAVVIARSYGPAVLGIYAIALAYSSIAVTVADNGLMVSSVVEISRAPSHGSRILSKVYAAKTLLFLPMLVILAALGIRARLSAAEWSISVLLTLKAMVQAYCQVNVGVLKSIGRMHLITVSQGLNFAVLATALALVYYSSWSISVLLAWMLGAQLVEWCLSTFFISRFGIRIEGLPFSQCWSLMRRSTAMGATYTVAALILRSDVIVASILFSTTEVGRFASAHMLLVVMYLSSWLFSSVMLPDLVRLVPDGPASRHYVRKWTGIIATVTVPACLIFSWAARRVFPLVYGPQFSSSSILATIMLLALPFIVLNALYVSHQIALGNPRVYLSVYVATGLGSIALSFLLGHLFGLPGIAVAIVAREAGMLGAFWFCRPRSILASVPAYPLTESAGQV
jgi:O-antigen/teichoic acid export membrane protein